MTRSDWLSGTVAPASSRGASILALPLERLHRPRLPTGTSLDTEGRFSAGSVPTSGRALSQSSAPGIGSPNRFSRTRSGPIEEEWTSVRMPWARKGRPGTLRGADSTDREHLVEFIRTRQGVEAFLEPRTTVTDTTLLLVAGDGEWTRRRVADVEAAETLAKKHNLPLYEAARVGYPQRMREWTARRKAAGEAPS